MPGLRTCELNNIGGLDSQKHRAQPRSTVEGSMLPTTKTRATTPRPRKDQRDQRLWAHASTCFCLFRLGRIVLCVSSYSNLAVELLFRNMLFLIRISKLINMISDVSTSTAVRYTSNLTNTMKYIDMILLTPITCEGMGCHNQWIVHRRMSTEETHLPKT